MTITRIDDYTARMRALLIEQYRNSTNFQNKLSITASEIQEVEDVLFQIRDLTSVDTATGATLDLVGENFGEPRNGLSDDEYRLKIYTRIAINNGGCDPEFIITTVRRLLDPVSILYAPLYPANFSLEIRKDDIDPTVIPLIRSLAPAGVGDVVIIQTPEAELFRFGASIIGEYQLVVVDEGERFPLQVNDENGMIYNLTVNDQQTLLPPEGAGFGAIIPTQFLATTTENEVLEIMTFQDGTPWRLISEGDEEFYTIEDGGVFGAVI